MGLLPKERSTNSGDLFHSWRNPLPHRGRVVNTDLAPTEWATPFTGFSSYEWLLLTSLIIGTQLLGHTLFNFSLKRVSPAVVSLIIFFEVPVSAILAYIWLGQKPPAGTIPGIIGLLFGCALFVLRSNQVNSDEKRK